MGSLEELVEPMIAAEYFVDGFADHQIINGIFTCSGYRLQRACRKDGKLIKVVAVKLIMPAGAAREANRATREAIEASPLESMTLENIGRH